MKLNIGIFAAAIAVILAPTGLFGQAQITTRREKIKDFTSKTTKVVMSGDEILDEALREAVTTSWSLSPYEFCSKDEFNALKTNAGHYFLLVVKGQEKKEYEPGIDLLTLVKGGPEAAKGINEMLEVVSFPLRSAQLPSGRELAVLPAIIKVMQDLTKTMTSSEMEIKLLNVARGSLQELRADYHDYLNTHRLSLWPADSERQQRLRDFCHTHNDYDAYAPLVLKMNDEEMANLLLTLCHQTDKMMCAYIEKLEQRFVKEGGIKERMYAARTGYRQQQDTYLHSLEAEIQRLKTENVELKQRIEELEARKL